MSSFVFKTLVLGASLVAATYPPIPDGWTDAKFTETVEVDSLIVGCGGAGGYAATKLTDAGKKIVVVERENRCGGHVQTYMDPKTNAPIEYGVQAYIQTAETEEWKVRY